MRVAHAVTMHIKEVQSVLLIIIATLSIKPQVQEPSCLMESVAPRPQDNIDKVPAIIAATCVVVGVTVIVVALRLAIRVWITKSVWWDDWTILSAIVRHYSISIAGTVSNSELDG